MYEAPLGALPLYGIAPDKFEKVYYIADGSEMNRGEAWNTVLYSNTAFVSFGEDLQFAIYEKLLKKEKLTDCAMVCTQDKMHYEPVVKALEKGYHVLCEKAMSTDVKEIRCLDGCPNRDECAFYAPKFYLDHIKAVEDGLIYAVSVLLFQNGM